MGVIELDGAAWRRIGEPVGEPAERALLALVAGVPGGLGGPERAREIGRDHLPLAALVRVLAEARLAREAQVSRLLGLPRPPTPFVLGLTGGVAVGKSMAAAAVAALLREQLGLAVAVVATDGFLHPNAELEARGIMDRKGFPESFDRQALVRFLEGVASGHDDVVAPVYDHLASDVVAGRGIEVGRPDVLVLEGINVLQLPDGPAATSVADHLHLSVYLDADEGLMHSWYTTRLLDLRARPAGDVPSYFRSMASFSDDEFVSLTDVVWEHVNRRNLVDHIAPTLPRADLVLEKGDDHRIRRASIRI